MEELAVVVILFLLLRRPGPDSGKAGADDAGDAGGTDQPGKDDRGIALWRSHLVYYMSDGELLDPLVANLNALDADFVGVRKAEALRSLGGEARSTVQRARAALFAVRPHPDGGPYPQVRVYAFPSIGDDQAGQAVDAAVTFSEQRVTG